MGTGKTVVIILKGYIKTQKYKSNTVTGYKGRKMGVRNENKSESINKAWVLHRKVTPVWRGMT